MIHAVAEDKACYYLGEDTGFCVRARQAGFKVMADLSVKLGHVGRYTYTWDDFAPKQRYRSVRFQIVPPGSDAVVIDTGDAAVA